GVNFTFTCDGRTRAEPNPTVSMSTRCGSESGNGIVVFTVRTEGIRTMMCRGPVTWTLSGSNVVAIGPGHWTVAISMAEWTGTLRDHVDSKRSVKLRGCTSRTTASMPSGSVTSPGRRSSTSVSGESDVICR